MLLNLMYLTIYIELPYIYVNCLVIDVYFAACEKAKKIRKKEIVIEILNQDY